MKTNERTQTMNENQPNDLKAIYRKWGLVTGQRVRVDGTAQRGYVGNLVRIDADETAFVRWEHNDLVGQYPVSQLRKV